MDPSGRSALARVPAGRPGRATAARIELRSPDPGCNPYLALALILGAGLRGIERGYALPAEDDAGAGSRPLPVDLREALETFAESELVRDVLGEHLCDSFENNKRAEATQQALAVTELERRTLLRML